MPCLQSWKLSKHVFHRTLPDEMFDLCLLCFRLQPHIQIPAQKDAAAHQQQSLLVAESAGKDAAALHACTMEQLPLGANALNSCTLEQLPQGSRVCSPAVASPLMDRSSSPVVMPAGMLAGHGPGLGAGLRGAGLSARNAVAALCSARRQTAEPRNAYRWLPICSGTPSILVHA